MITCPACGATSHNPHDEREGYCGACHDYTSTPRCPWCGDPPVLTLAGGRQSFCGNESCRCVVWNGLESMKANVSDFGTIDFPNV